VSWRLADSLIVLRREVDAAFPHRSKASDGTIGDASHVAEGTASDHNPWVHDPAGVGVVRAFDITSAGLKAPGITADDIAEKFRLLGLHGDDRLTGGGYVIFNRRIASGVADWKWRTYHGSSPHTEHIHLSVSRHQSGYDAKESWGLASGLPLTTHVRVTVQANDTLGKIAARAHVSMGRIHQLNPGLFDARHKQGNLIFPGEKVLIS
jgi:hypothetical protein